MNLSKSAESLVETVGGAKRSHQGRFIMSQYLLSVHAVEGQTPPDLTPEEMQRSMESVMALESEMKASGAFVFGGKLHDADVATVVRMSSRELSMTDGPFAEAKEHIAGFYVINADDLDSALGWAGRVTELIGQPIEVRPFFDMPAS
jgi:hypothetical protein